MTVGFNPKQLINLFSLIFGALGFSVGILTIRIFSDESSLAFILNLQSMVVFISFLLQMGLRAALRAQIYKGRLLLARTTEKSLQFFLLLISIIAISGEIIYGEFYYIGLSSLLAIVTLRLGFNVAEGNPKAIFFNSLATFFIAVSSSVILIIVNKQFITNCIIELVALFFIIITSYPFKLKKIYIKKKSILRVYWLAQSYQLGAGMISLFMFLLTQSALTNLTSENQLVAYSDALIIGGLLVMLLGKALLLLERKLYAEENNHLLIFTSLIFGQLVISILTSYILHVIYGVGLVLYFSILFVLLSRLSVGYVVQYVSKCRGVLNRLSVLYLLLYSTFIFIDIEKFEIVYQALPLLIFILLGVIFFSKE